MSNAREALERIANEPMQNKTGEEMWEYLTEIARTALADMQSDEPVLWIDTDELERVRKSNRDVWLPAYIGPNYENATQPLYLKADRRKE